MLKGNSGWDAEKCHLLLEFSEKQIILLKLRDTCCSTEIASSNCASSWALTEVIGRGEISRRGEGLGLTLRLIKQGALIVIRRSLGTSRCPGLQLAASATPRRALPICSEKHSVVYALSHTPS